MSELVQKLQTRFGTDSFTTTSFAGNVRVNVTADKLFGFLKGLKEEFAFDYLVDIAGIDYLHYPEATNRYGVVYCLANTETAERLFVRAFANDPAPRLPSVYPLWKGANWLEREVYDMFGIVFDGHPDLRRILMPEGFASYPLRKDYPMRGRGERHNFETVSRADS